MTQPSPHSLAIVGAGPIGLEAAVAAAERGFDVHVLERGEVGAHPSAWGHVRMFTPWRMNVGPRSAEHLARAGWSAPDPEERPMGLEFAERCLQPIARLPVLEKRVHAHAQVVAIGKSGLAKGDQVGDPARGERAFRLLVRDAGGRENFLHAFAVIDASGVYGQPGWAGDGGIPARGELYLRPQMAYHLDDVLGLARERYAGRRTIVIGGGPSAATVVADLARLADEAPGTGAVWATREPLAELCREVPDDPLAGRRELFARARALAAGAHPAIEHVAGAWVEGFEFNSATHRYRVNLRAEEKPRIEEVDQVVVLTGFGPDDSLHRELQVHACYATLAPMKLATALLGATDCLDVPAGGVDLLVNPEPRFFILGHKSYGRSSHFLLATGFRQVAETIDRLARELPVGAAS